MEEIREQYGYVYLTICLSNLKIYIGQAKRKEFDKKYLGSGKYLKRAIEKHERENFECKQINIAFSREELCEQEKFWIKYFRDLGYIMYNITSGGEFGDAMTYNPNRKEIGRKISKGQLNSEEFQKATRSKERGDKISKSRLASKKAKDSYSSKERNDKISKKHKGTKSKRDISPHCLESHALNILKQFHNDKCWKNPNYTYEEQKERRKINISNRVGKKREKYKKSKKKRKIRTKEHSENISKSKIKANKKRKELGINLLKRKKFKQKRGTCQNCLEEFALNILTKYHGDRCFKNPNIDIEAEILRRKKGKYKPKSNETS